MDLPTFGRPMTATKPDFVIGLLFMTLFYQKLLDFDVIYVYNALSSNRSLLDIRVFIYTYRRRFVYWSYEIDTEVSRI